MKIKLENVRRERAYVVKIKEVHSNFEAEQLNTDAVKKGG